MLLSNHDDNEALFSVQSTTFNAVKFVSKTMQMKKSKDKKKEKYCFNKIFKVCQSVMKNSLSPDKVTLSLILC